MTKNTSVFEEDNDGNPQYRCAWMFQSKLLHIRYDFTI